MTQHPPSSTEKEPERNPEQAPPRQSDPEPDSGAVPEADGEPEKAAKSPVATMNILCVRNLVLFPGVVLPINVGRKASIESVQGAVRTQQPIGILLQKNAETENPGPDDLHPVGCVAEVLRYVTAVDGSHHVICQGEQRFRVLEFAQREPFLTARIERHFEPEELPKEIEARFITLKEQAREALQLLPQVPQELEAIFQSIDSPSAMADMVVTYMDLDIAQKQEILELFDLEARLDKVSKMLAHRLEVLRLSRDITRQTKGSLDKAQREYYLREQLKTIQQELGEGDGKSVEVAELTQAIEKARMPTEAEKEARRELGRLERMPEAAAEYAMIRTYLDWLIDLPWNTATQDNIDIRRAREILDRDHYGLEKVKKRILEFLAVRKLKPDGKSAILCLVGPPGVGKTSIGQSIARAMNRKFARVSLGGVHDEAEIRGHRRTYIGALPGNVIQGIRRARVNNPVFMLDELDKLGSSYHGDPASALLEVLDPEQNNTFRDHYIDVPFDLSRVMFIGTANVLDGIAGPLRDRCEVIEMPGYTEEEKIEIAKRYLVGRRLEENGLGPAYCKITDEALRDIVRHYTREAGCRNLERQIGAVCRHVATRLAEALDKPAEAIPAPGKPEERIPAERISTERKLGAPPPAGEPAAEGAPERPLEKDARSRGDDGAGEETCRAPILDLEDLPPSVQLPVTIDKEDLPGILGQRKYESETAMRTSLPGVATGLAWTPTGGEILFVEATSMHGKGNLILTGQLGDIMKESAQTAVTLLKTRCAELGVEPKTFDTMDIHIHVPAGAIPKDGPSAGVTMFTALYSLLSGRTVREDIAMTGEISLRGLVLPVGGIKEKVLAARSAEILTVLLPARNKKDYDDIPAAAREKLKFIWLDKVEEAVAAALSPPAEGSPSGSA